MRSFSALSGLAAVVLLALPSEAATNSTINSQVRLAYAGNTGMYVSWNTFNKLDNPAVKYGLSPNSLNQSASSNVSITYPTSLTYNNHVKITGLQLDTTYYYAPNELLGNTTSLPYTFRTSRPAGDGTPYSVAIVVDLGTMGAQGLTTSAGKGVVSTNILTPNETNTIQSLTAALNSYEFLWHPGDIAYADYWLKEEIQGFLPNTTIADGYKVYESILNDFYDEMSTITTFKPYMVGPGNHESNCDNGGTTDSAHNITYNVSICIPGQTNFTGYINHFRMPSNESGGTGNFWYSFDHGMAHYIQLDTETDLGHGYMGNDGTGGSEGDASGPFSSIMNAQTNWPWYLSHANASGTICWTCKDVFEPLLIQYGVDLVLSGHSHVYERNAPIANGVIDKNELDNPSSPWYIANGAAGHYDGLDALQVPYQKYQRYGLDTTNATYGWSKLTFHNCTHLTHDFVASKNGAIMDTATLYKNRTCAVGKSLGDSAVLNSTGGATGVTANTAGRIDGALVPIIAAIAALLVFL
ncbi:related to acid phosphatase precursor (pH 6-optimum acid phosphatase) [Phialocephala subalpina]|uniref:Purple acid phosphatase n=1 Tax=Phialocephala subalpina TaxID=576137 RepID=A0A1L7XBZ3_9HELO|nr:related to acid phosphatase precursor (pH 6-optimum acid phosphatase) [Phialocephala subalpina]